MTQEPMGHYYMARSTRGNPPTDSMFASLLFVLAIVLVLNLTACTTVKKEGFKANEHIVMVNGDGELIDPRSNFLDPESGYHLWFKPYSKLPSSIADTQVGSGQNQDSNCQSGKPTDSFCELFAAIEKAPLPKVGARKKKRLLLFVHGGMNSAHQSIQRAADYSSEILKDATDGAYPIFINWDSSLTTSYIDHLFFLRQGERVDDWCCKSFKESDRLAPYGGLIARLGGGLVSVATAPFYATFDLVRGPVRFPTDMAGIYKEMIAGHWHGDRENKTCNESIPVGITPRADHLLCNYHRDPQNSLLIAQGSDKREGFEQAQQIGVAAVGGLSSAHALSVLGSDIVGTGAWSSMNRRTTVMFHRDEDFSDPDLEKQYPTGGIALFMNKFRTFINDDIKANHGRRDWEIVLVGHSMGAIVVNEMVRRFGHPLDDDPAKNPLFDKIVYMAAATSLRDYLNTIPPYLKEYGKEHGQNHEEPRVYHLTLNDRAEADEQYLPLTHPGSLLVWIDMFFARPDAQLDYVAGRYANLLGVIHLHDKSIRNRISVKSFNYGKYTEGENPQSHGDFDEFPFWREDFWTVRGLDPSSVRRCEKAKQSSDLCPR